MLCPNCGQEMEAGRIYNGRRDIGFVWMPEGNTIPRIVTRSAVEKKNGLLWGEQKSLSPFNCGGNTQAHICRKCSIGVFTFTETGS